MRRWLTENRTEVTRWAGLIGGAFIVSLLTLGTSYRQLGIGVLASSVALLVCLMVFEVIWRAVDMIVVFFEGDRKA
jgi:hypothetical protein